MSLRELQSAVNGLPPADRSPFLKWAAEQLADAWDEQIEADIAAGRLDAAGRAADADFEAGRCTSLSAIAPDDIPQWHKDVLDRRLAEAEANPGAGRPWREVLDELN